MKKIKNLSENDLNDISDFLSNEINKEISKILSNKEIINLEINIETVFDDKDKNLDVDADVNVETDGLRDIPEETIQETIDIAYKKLDNYIEVNYKE